MNFNIKLLLSRFNFLKIKYDNYIFFINFIKRKTHNLRSKNEPLSLILNKNISKNRNLDILESGVGLNRYKIINVLAKFSTKEIDFYETVSTRINHWMKNINRLKIINNNQFNFVTLKKYDVISISFRPKYIRYFFSKVIYDYLFLLKSNSILILTFPLSIDRKFSSDQNLIDDISKFKSFVEINQSKVNDYKLDVDELFKNFDFKILDIIEPVYCPFKGFNYQTIVIKFNKKINSNKSFLDLTNSFTKLYPINNLNKDSRFSLYNYCKFLDELMDSKPVVNIEKFHKNLKLPYFKREPYQLIKHDIHSDIISALKMAKAENKLGVSSIYFAMHQSDHTKYFFNNSSYVDALREIQGYGHEIGIHCDSVYYTVEGLRAIDEISKFADFLRSNGIRVRLANTHGNSKYYFKFKGDISQFSEYVLKGDKNFTKSKGGIGYGFSEDNDILCTSEMIFKELFNTHPYINKNNIDDDKRILVNNISLKDLMKKAKFLFWIDTTIYDEKINGLVSQISVTDNNNKIEIWGSNLIAESKNFSFHDQSKKKLISKIDKEAAHLYHPQLYV